MNNIFSKRAKRETRKNYFLGLFLSLASASGSAEELRPEKILLDSSVQCLRVVAEQDISPSPPQTFGQKLENTKEAILPKGEIAEKDLKLFLEFKGEGLARCEWSGVRIVAYQSVKEGDIQVGNLALCFSKVIGGPIGKPDSEEAIVNAISDNIRNIGEREVADDVFEAATIVKDDPLDLSKPLWVNFCYRKVQDSGRTCDGVASKLHIWEIKNFEDAATSSFPGSQIRAVDICVEKSGK